MVTFKFSLIDFTNHFKTDSQYGELQEIPQNSTDCCKGYGTT